MCQQERWTKQAEKALEQLDYEQVKICINKILSNEDNVRRLKSLSRGRYTEHMSWQQDLYQTEIKAIVGKTKTKTKKYIFWCALFNGDLIDDFNTWGEFLRHARIPGEPNVIEIEDGGGRMVTCACGQTTPNIIYIHICNNPSNEYKVLLGSECIKKYVSLLQCKTTDVCKKEKCNQFIKNVSRHARKAKQKKKREENQRRRRIRKSKRGIKSIHKLVDGENVKLTINNLPIPIDELSNTDNILTTSSDGEQFNIRMGEVDFEEYERGNISFITADLCGDKITFEFYDGRPLPSPERT